jgi:hypothetical protein
MPALVVLVSRHEDVQAETLGTMAFVEQTRVLSDYASLVEIARRLDFTFLTSTTSAGSGKRRNLLGYIWRPGESVSFDPFRSNLSESSCTLSSRNPSARNIRLPLCFRERPPPVT